MGSHTRRDNVNADQQLQDPKHAMKLAPRLLQFVSNLSVGDLLRGL
jgi:hypothetical protein